MAKRTIYDNLNSFTLGNVAAKDVNSQQEPVNIMEVNQNKMDQLNRINKSLFRDGRPIPNSMKIVSITLNETDTKVTLLQPEKGEVWMLQQLSLVRTANSGTCTFYVQYYDGTTEANALYASTGGTELILTSDDNYAGNTYFVDNNVYFRAYRASGSATYNLIATFSRVR